MNLAQLKKFCREFPAASERLLPPPYNILVYSIDKQNFAYFKTSEPEQWRFSIKVTPSQFVELTGLPGCKPARYRGRYHWITIVDVAHFPDDYLRELVMGSYQFALAKVPKSKRPKTSGNVLV
jgi:predicted DNA-binding protein (MmcQ/YjbR family)